MNAPCKTCGEERHFNCHSHCEKYLAFKAKREQLNKMRRAAIQREYITYNPKEDKHYWREKKLQTQGKGKYSK